MFGRNHCGQLGTGDDLDRCKRACWQKTDTLSLQSQYTTNVCMYLCRWRPATVNFGHTGELEGSYRAVQVVMGSKHSLALIAHRGRIKCFAAGGCRVHPFLVCRPHNSALLKSCHSMPAWTSFRKQLLWSTGHWGSHCS
jgi:hypothetical protein